MNMRMKVELAGWLAFVSVAVMGCAGHHHPHGQAEHATAVLAPTDGNQTKGTVRFTQTDHGVRVVAHVTGLSPGKHGFHVHEHGDCSSPDGNSAGGHFNPTSMPHGGPDSAQHHVGDLGNLEANANGEAHLDKVFSYLSLEGEKSIIGRGMIVHGGADDFTTQPTGNAGARVACGKIAAD